MTDVAIKPLACDNLSKSVGMFPPIGHTIHSKKCDSGSVKIPAKLPTPSSSVRNDKQDIRGVRASQVNITAFAQPPSRPCEEVTGVTDAAIQPFAFENQTIPKPKEYLQIIRHFYPKRLQITKSWIPSQVLGMTDDNRINLHLPQFVKNFSRFTSHVSPLKIPAFILAEGATHVANSANIRKSAFTMAEVLITLGVIGIVAAMALPTLIKNYNNLVYTTKLKKSVANIENTFRFLMARDGVDTLDDTQLFQSIHEYAKSVGCEANHVLSGTWTCESFFENLEKEFKLVRIVPQVDIPTKMLDGRNDNNYKGKVYYMLPGGSAIAGYFRFYGFGKDSQYETSDYKQIGYFHLDINGTKKPNRWGRDIYRFDLTNQGFLVPQGSMKYSRFNNGDDSQTWQNSDGCGPRKYTHGGGCASRIIEAGWKMDY